MTKYLQTQFFFWSHFSIFLTFLLTVVIAFQINVTFLLVQSVYLIPLNYVQIKFSMFYMLITPPTPPPTAHNHIERMSIHLFYSTIA